MQAYLANTFGQVQFFFWVLAFALSCLRVAAPPHKLRSFVGQMAKVSALAAQYAPRHAEIPWRVSQWPSNGSRNAAGTSDSAPEALACNPSTACDVQCQVYTNQQSGPVGELASCFLYLSKLSMDTKDMSKRSASQLSSFFSLRLSSGPKSPFLLEASPTTVGETSPALPEHGPCQQPLLSTDLQARGLIAYGHINRSCSHCLSLQSGI